MRQVTWSGLSEHYRRGHKRASQPQQKVLRDVPSGSVSTRVRPRRTASGRNRTCWMAGYIPRRPSSHLTRQVGAHSLSFDNGALVLRFLPLSGNAAPHPRICVALGD